MPARTKKFRYKKYKAEFGMTTLPASMTFGAVPFARWDKKFMYTNPMFGRSAPPGDYNYTTQNEPVLYTVFNEETGRVHVTTQFTIQELQTLLRAAEKRTKKFKGGAHFIHAGNLSIFVTGAK